MGFAILALAAFLYRPVPQTHKWLIIVATIGVLAPATARRPFAFAQAYLQVGYFGLTDLVPLASSYTTWLFSARTSHLPVGRATDCGRAGNGCQMPLKSSFQNGKDEDRKRYTCGPEIL